MATLTLARHGQSAWNLENRFTGWVDVQLTDQGVAEARKAGHLIAGTGVEYDRCYASVLTRAIRTLNLALEEMDRLWLPVTKDWRLNERHYGGLTGLNKAETAEKHGEDQVKVWRRSYDVPPPPIAEDNPDNPNGDRRYAGIADLPLTESLKTTLDRVKPYFDAEIAPKLRGGENVLIAAHGNSLRALVKLLFGVSDAEIVEIEIPTGNPLELRLGADLSVKAARYLDDERATGLPSV